MQMTERVHKGRWLKRKKKEGADEEEAGRVSKDQTTFTTSFLRTKMRLLFEGY